MEAITASLERSLQNCSLNNNNNQNEEGSATIDVAAGEGRGGGGGIGISSSSSSSDENHISNNSDATLELNSNISLPYHWEQCLDLKVLPLFSYSYLFFFQNLLTFASCMMLDLFCSISLVFLI